MIVRAQQVIAGIPGVHLHPFLLAESQSGGATGYIMIAYQHHLTFDILFLHGPGVVECARINPDLRFPIDPAAAEAMFLRHREMSLISLYQSSPADVERFLVTFHSEPCLKVHVDGISRTLIRSLIQATGCCTGIIERNNFQRTPPQVELAELRLPGPLPRFRTGLRHGRLLLYDLQKNQDRDAQRLPHPVEPPASGKDESSPLPLPTDPGTASGRVRKPGRKPAASAGDKGNRDTAHGENTQASASVVDAAAGAAHQPVPGDGSPAGKAPSPLPEQSQQAGDGQYVRQFQRLFRSFRQQAFRCFGPRCETVATEAERHVRFLLPEFDMNNLSAATAPSVLDVIEAMIERAPFLKRSRLRAAAAALVADLYNKQFEVLEAHSAIDRVEQHYYRLKK